MLNKFKFVIAGLLVSTLLGCGGDGKPSHIPDLVPYSVKVSHQGEPVEGAKVMLAPVNSTFSAAAETDKSGVAVLKTDGIYPGVVPGEYMVSVSKYEIIKNDLGPVPSDPAGYAAYEKKLKSLPKPKSLLPERFSSFTKSKLTASVAAGLKEPVPIELKD